MAAKNIAELTRQIALLAKSDLDRATKAAAEFVTATQDLQDVDQIPDGIRQELARMAAEMTVRLQTIEAIRCRVGF